MSGLIVRGSEVQVPGLVVKNWHDVPKWRLKMGQDGKYCGERKVLGVVWHTSKGLPGGSDKRAQVLHPGAGPAGGIDKCVDWWANPDSGSAGAHLVVDRDGTVGCLADIVYEVAYHAGSPNNGYTVGIEVYQDSDAGLWQASLDAVALLGPALHDILGLPHQTHWPYIGGPSPRLDKPGGVDYRGSYGHRDCDHHRGLGDPGDFVIRALIDVAGFEAFDTSEDEDLQAWRIRQAQLNTDGCRPPLTVDGIPGPKTMAAWNARRA